LFVGKLLNRKFVSILFIVILCFYIFLATSYNFSTPINEGRDEHVHISWIKEYATGEISLSTFAKEAPFFYVVNSLFLKTLTIGDEIPESPPVFHHHSVSIQWPEETFPFEGYALIFHLLRFVSIGLTLITIIFVYKISQLVFKKSTWEVLIPPLLVVLFPNFVWHSSTLNSDIMLITFSTIAIYLLVRYQNFSKLKEIFLMGIFVGLAILTKGNGLLLLPLFVGVFSIKIFQRKLTLKHFFKIIFTFGISISIGLWYTLGIIIFEFEQRKIVGGATGRVIDLLSVQGFGDSFRRFSYVLVNDFWGGLGPQSISGSPGLQLVYSTITIIILILIGVFLFFKLDKKIPEFNHHGFSVMAFSIIVVIIGFILLLSIGGGQTRNSFLIIAPISVFVSYGLIYGTLPLKKFRPVLIGIILIILFVGTLSIFATYEETMISTRTPISELLSENTLENMLFIYNSRPDLARAFPEVKNQEYGNLVLWSVKHTHQYPAFLGNNLKYNYWISA